MNRMDTQEMERRRVLRRGFLDKLAEELSGSPYYAACRERTAALAAQFGKTEWKDLVGELPWMAVSAFIELLTDCEEWRIVL